MTRELKELAEEVSRALPRDLEALGTILIGVARYRSSVRRAAKRGPDGLAAYLLGMFKNAERREYRRARTVGWEKPGLDVLRDRSAPDPERAAELSEATRRALEALGQLDSRKRRVFELRMFEGLSFKEIERDTGIAEVSARSIVNRAKGELREVLNRLPPSESA